MELDQIANVAEIVGVVLVVVTLVFLTLQIRQNTKAIRVTTMKSAMQSEMEFASIFISEAAVWEKVLRGEPIEAGEETRKSILLLNVFMVDTEARFQQYNAGFLDAQMWIGRMNTLPKVVMLPTFNIWRTSLGGISHAADFLDLLDKIEAKGIDERSQ